jgi:GNAT superfamily N-acetyltransferase
MESEAYRLKPICRFRGFSADQFGAFRRRCSDGFCSTSQDVKAGVPVTADFEVRQATRQEIEPAYAIVAEYYEAATVVARDTCDEFARLYFAPGSGFWLARRSDSIVGCIALRPLPSFGGAAEVKRLYVQPAHRGLRIAYVLHDALRAYAKSVGYRYLYLDTTEQMSAAVRFYEGQGYIRCSRYNDNPQASIFMRKEIQQDGFEAV